MQSFSTFFGAVFPDGKVKKPERTKRSGETVFFKTIIVSLFR